MIDRAVYTAVVERCLQLEAGAPPTVHAPLVRRRITRAIGDQIRVLWAQGMERNAIAAQLNVAYSAVWHRTRAVL